MALIISALILLIFFINHSINRSRRVAFINSYPFPTKVTESVKAKYPHLSDADVERVIDGLRSYFQACNQAGKKTVSMPSQVVDIAWHEFILFTRDYQQFCKRAFGRFLHHTPAEAMSSPIRAQNGIKRAWAHACQLEKIQPKAAYRLPLLFALDAQLKIPDGFTYTLNCQAYPGQQSGDGTTSPYCATHIGCSSSGSKIFGCAGGNGSDSGSSGCSGGGCGGS